MHLAIVLCQLQHWHFLQTGKLIMNMPKEDRPIYYYYIATVVQV
jgi:hypothetical protein